MSAARARCRGAVGVEGANHDRADMGAGRGPCQWRIRREATSGPGGSAGARVQAQVIADGAHKNAYARSKTGFDGSVWLKTILEVCREKAARVMPPAMDCCRRGGGGKKIGRGGGLYGERGPGVRGWPGTANATLRNWPGTANATPRDWPGTANATRGRSGGGAAAEEAAPAQGEAGVNQDAAGEAGDERGTVGLGGRVRRREFQSWRVRRVKLSGSGGSTSGGWAVGRGAAASFLSFSPRSAGATKMRGRPPGSMTSRPRSTKS